VFQSILAFLSALRVFFRSRSDIALEVLALRQQVAVLKRERPRPILKQLDRLFWTSLRRYWPRWPEGLVIVKPGTVVGWHRASWRFYWRWRAQPRRGRPQITEEIRELIQRLAPENSNWGAPAQDPWRTTETGIPDLRTDRGSLSAADGAPWRSG
jgi:putative transposase